MSAQDSTPEIEPEIEPEQASGGRVRRPVIAAPVIPALVAALVVAAALAAVAAFGAHRASGLADARSDALEAATSRVPDLLSYDAATLTDDLAQALEQTTGSFRDDYQRILDDAVEPTATEREISTTAAVSAAGVVSGDTDEVVVLLFLTQTTTAGDSAPSVTGSRVEVTMSHVDGDWLIAGLEPV